LYTRRCEETGQRASRGACGKFHRISAAVPHEWPDTMIAAALNTMMVELASAVETSSDQTESAECAEVRAIHDRSHGDA